MRWALFQFDRDITLRILVNDLENIILLAIDDLFLRDRNAYIFKLLKLSAHVIDTWL